MIILKNINGKETVDTVFRGKKIVIKPKHSMILDAQKEEDRAKAQFLLSTYGFLVDITERIKQERGGEVV